MSRGGKKERRQNKFVKIISLNNFIAGQNGRTRADIIGEGEGKSCRDIFLENRDALLHYHVSAYKFPRERRDNIIFFLSPPPPSLSPSLTVTGAHPLEHVLQRWLILHINCLPAGEKWETGIQGTLFTRRTERKRGRERESSTWIRLKRALCLSVSLALPAARAPGLGQWANFLFPTGRRKYITSAYLIPYESWMERGA